MSLTSSVREKRAPGRTAERLGYFPADLADATGLTAAFSDALAPLRVRRSGHDPGRVAVDLAVMLADGGEAIADLAVLRNQADLFGAVASDPTAWRLLSGGDHTAVATNRSPRIDSHRQPCITSSPASQTHRLTGPT
jgi:hypothetical protein